MSALSAIDRHDQHFPLSNSTASTRATTEEIKSEQMGHRIFEIKTAQRHETCEKLLLEAHVFNQRGECEKALEKTFLARFFSELELNCAVSKERKSYYEDLRGEAIHIESSASLTQSERLIQENQLGEAYQKLKIAEFSCADAMQMTAIKDELKVLLKNVLAKLLNLEAICLMQKAGCQDLNLSFYTLELATSPCRQALELQGLTAETKSILKDTLAKALNDQATLIFKELALFIQTRGYEYALLKLKESKALLKEALSIAPSESIECLTSRGLIKNMLLEAAVFLHQSLQAKNEQEDQRALQNANSAEESCDQALRIPYADSPFFQDIKGNLQLLRTMAVAQRASLLNQEASTLILSGENYPLAFQKAKEVEALCIKGFSFFPPQNFLNIFSENLSHIFAKQIFVINEQIKDLVNEEDYDASLSKAMQIENISFRALGLNISDRFLFQNFKTCQTDALKMQDLFRKRKEELGENAAAKKQKPNAE